MSTLVTEVLQITSCPKRFEFSLEQVSNMVCRRSSKVKMSTSGTICLISRYLVQLNRNGDEELENQYQEDEAERLKLNSEHLYVVSSDSGWRVKYPT